MTSAQKLALLKELTATTDADAVLASYLDMAGRAILNRAYPYADVDVDKIVKSTNMIVGGYTIARQPSRVQNVTVTVTTSGNTDTLGTIVITGYNVSGEEITETLTPVANQTVEGTLLFKKVTSVVGSGWVINETNDTITVGVGDLTEVPAKYESLQCEIAAFLLNKRGAEGQISHGENGISRTYEGGGIPPSMLNEVIPCAGVYT